MIENETKLAHGPNQTQPFNYMLSYYIVSLHFYLITTHTIIWIFKIMEHLSIFLNGNHLWEVLKVTQEMKTFLLCPTKKKKIKMYFVYNLYFILSKVLFSFSFSWAVHFPIFFFLLLPHLSLANCLWHLSLWWRGGFH
jgi:hypothetical protein